MAWIIDRVESGFAIVEHIETLEITNVPLSELPANAKEGDAVVTDPGKGYRINSAETGARKERAAKLLNKLKRKNQQT